jgi:hypothetical protein
MDKVQVKEWTVMFFFASDNPLAPGIVSQLKAIKHAGFHPEANVIAQFDPNTEGTSTHIFDVNLVKKLESPGRPNIGFTANDPSVMSLMEDKLWRDQTNRDGNALIRDQIKALLAKRGITYDPPVPPEDRIASKSPTRGNPKEPGPKISLANFLKFCCDNYPARHYMLFILGHGLVVGNDVFLYDEHADVHWLALKELGEVLTDFKKGIQEDSESELVSFHSCSVSALEVAFELQGTANYMLASQGPAFVGSWPYRQILIRVFNDLMENERVIVEGRDTVKEMLVRIFYCCLHNSTDFLLAGYSFDLCLCNLNEIPALTQPIQSLSKALVDGLDDPLVRNFILLSHLKSQSYWQESYTDLYDFCFCLSESRKQLTEAGGYLYDKVQAIDEACGLVMDKLVKESVNGDGNFIVRAEFAGPAYQYSHGLFVFFPWSEPSSDSLVMEDYKRYRFEETSWRTFLDAYFEKTMRETRKTEHDHRSPIVPEPTDEENLFEDMACLVCNEEAQLRNGNSFSVLKVHPRDPTGDDDSTYPSIKNYPHDTRARRERGRQADQRSRPTSDTFFRQM